MMLNLALAITTDTSGVAPATADLRRDFHNAGGNPR